MPGSIRVGSLLGIPLQINISWFVIFALVTFSLVAVQFPARYPFWSTATYVIVGIATSLLFFASVIVHELAHSMVARVIGVPVKSITLFIFGGVTQITRDAARPVEELTMAAAGPLASFALAGLFALLWAIFRSIHEPTMALAGWLALINLALGLFNLIPGFPMDGGRVLRSLFWWATGSHSRATRIAVAVGHEVAYVLILGGIILVFLIPQYMFNGIWLIFIGWFLTRAASGSLRQTRAREMLQGYTARDLMTTNLSPVPQGLTVQQLVEQYVARTPRSWFLVTDGPQLRGLITTLDARKIPQHRWGSTYVGDVMTPIEHLPKTGPQSEVVDLLEEMEDKEVRHMPVVEHGALVGMVAQNGLLRAARARHELGV